MGNTDINRDNYIVVQGWMISELNLKGNELLIYACIYGFSQAENQVFNGSLQYLANWTNSTKQGVIKNLKSLVEKGYIQKTDKTFNGVKFCEYRTTKFNSPVNKVAEGVKQSLPGGIEQSLPNNISFDNKEKSIDIKEIYNSVVAYLNEKAGTNFKAASKATQQHINARIAEGFTLEDFKTVIDKKCLDWIGTEWEQYLRPATLFGTKFESYLNAPVTKRKTYGATGVEINADAVDDLAGVF